tara:strand:- start:25 stop:375 length:351 start_codon:yes stop_codon:yes gene_type:complete
MAITTTWSIKNMNRNASDGGVSVVTWSCVAKNDAGTEDFEKSHKYLSSYDASASDFTAYSDLTEEQVLGWVYTSLIKESETASEAKSRIEQECTDQVTQMIDRNLAVASGVPWAAE